MDYVLSKRYVYYFNRFKLNGSFTVEEVINKMDCSECAVYRDIKRLNIDLELYGLQIVKHDCRYYLGHLDYDSGLIYRINFDSHLSEVIGLIDY